MADEPALNKSNTTYRTYPETLPCWNCDGQMKRFAEDTFYHYYKCPACGKEKMEPKERPGA